MSTGEPAIPGRVRPAPPAVWALSFVLAGAATILWVLGTPGTRGLAGGGWRIAALAAAFAVAEFVVVHLHFRGGAFTATLSEVPLVVGLFTLAPQGLLLAQLVGIAVWIGIQGRVRPVRAAFNLAQYALTVTLTVSVLSVLGTRVDPNGPATWMSTLAATLAGSLVSGVAVAAAIRVSDGQPVSRNTWRETMFGLAVTAVNTTIGLLLVVLHEAHAAGPMLLVLPGLLTVLAYRALTREREQREALALLNRTARRISGSADLSGALAALVEEATSTLRAQSAHVVMIPPDAGGLHFHEDADGAHLSSLPADRTARLLEMVAKKSDPVLGPADALDGVTGTALLAPMRSDGRLVGVLVLVDRSGPADAWTAGDLAVVQSLADQAAVAIRLDWVEQEAEALEEERRRLRVRVDQDALTGLATRTMLADRLRSALARTSDGAHLLYADLDGFKQVNDTLGHTAGDELLVAVARRLRSCVQPGEREVLARLGGDEFAVLTVARSDADIDRLAAAIVDAVAEPFAIGTHLARIGVSIGVARATARCTATSLVERADAAMYRAKRAGKGTVVHADATS